MLATFGLICLFILTVFFLCTMYKTLKLVPKEKHIMPAWFCWLILIPMVGYVFAWMLLPFVVPKTLAHQVGDNPAALKATKNLFAIGLATVIVMLFEIVPVVNILAFLISVILTIVYWVKLINFRDTFLKPQTKAAPVLRRE